MVVSTVVSTGMVSVGAAVSVGWAIPASVGFAVDELSPLMSRRIKNPRMTAATATTIDVVELRLGRAEAADLRGRRWS
jgi:hypothetical protein